MNLTVGIVSFLLSADYEVAADFDPELDFPFDEWRIYDGRETAGRVLYLVDEPIADTRTWRNRLILSLCDPPEKLPSGCHYLHVREKRVRERSRTSEKRFIDLVNALQAASSRFTRWVRLSEQELGTTGDVCELLRLLERELGLVSILVNRNLRHIAASDSFSDANPWYKASETSMDFNMVNELMADEAFQRAIEHREPFFYHYAKGAETYSACFNVIVEGHYEARLLVQVPTGEKMLGQLAIAAGLGQCIADAFERSASGYEERPRDPAFEKTVASLLHAPPTRVDELRRQLEMRAWSISHTYRVHVFSFMQPESESVTRRYYESSISRLFAGCCVIAQGDLICCVRNLSVEGARAASAQQDLVLYLRENLCWCGTSCDFDNICELASHYEEARSALRLGVASGSTEWHFRFGDFVVAHVLERACDGVSRESLCHPAYSELAGHDEAHGTCLLETARCFMDCRYNVTQTASRLGIHRSSVIARLERIEELTGFDWNDGAERLHLALTFAFMAQ